MKQNYTPNNIYYHCNSISLSLDLEFYFFLSMGIDLGGFSTKYCSKSLMTYPIERSYFFDILSRKDFISSVVRKFKETDFTSFIVMQCNTIITCNSNIKSLILTAQCNTSQCITFIK